eukprot:6635247-Pyramimonas_sp.AAC.1
MLDPPGRHIPSAYLWPMSSASPRGAPMKFMHTLLNWSLASHISADPAREFQGVSATASRLSLSLWG